MSEQIETARASFNRIMRSLVSATTLATGGYGGYWLALIASELIRISNSSEPEKKLASAATIIAASFKVAQDGLDIYKKAYMYAKQGGDLFDPLKTMISTAALIFALTLSATELLGEGQTEPGSDISTEFVHLVQNGGSSAPLSLITPTLVFSSAALIDRDAQDFTDITQVKPDHFSPHSVNFTEAQHRAAERLVARLDSACISDEYKNQDMPLKLTVYGFANDMPILNGSKAKRSDSDLLNLAISNFRGKTLLDSLNQAIDKRNNGNSRKILLQWSPWPDLNEMIRVRDKVAFRNIEITYSGQIDHRSAVLVADNPSDCKPLNTQPPAQDPEQERGPS